MAFLTRRQSPFHVAEPADERKPDLLLWSLSLMILIAVWRIQDLFPVLGILELNLVVTAVTIGLFAIDRDPLRHLSKVKSPILFCLLAVLTLAILGVPMSLWPRRSATIVVRDFLQNLLLMVLVAAIVRDMRDLARIATVILAGAWMFSLFVHLNFEAGPTGRLNHLVYYDSNDLALVLVCTIPFAIFFLVRQGRRYQLFALASLALFVATLAKTGSRGGFLGFAAVLVYILVGYRAIRRRVRMVAIAGVMGLLTILAGEAYWNAMRTLRDPQQDYNWAGRSAEGRMEIWRRGLRYIAADPFLGVGMGNFPLAEGMLSEESRTRAERGVGFKWSVAHNVFLPVAVELGLIAFAFFVATLIAAFRALHRLRSVPLLHDPQTQRRVALACTLTASLVGFLVSGLFISAAFFSYLYVLLGLTMGFVKIHRHDRLPSLEWSGWHPRVAARHMAAVSASLHRPSIFSRSPRSAAVNRRKRNPQQRG